MNFRDLIYSIRLAPVLIDSAKLGFAQVLGGAEQRAGVDSLLGLRAENHRQGHIAIVLLDARSV